MTGIELIAAERERQVSQEGWTPEHDDTNGSGEMARAAVCYAEVTYPYLLRAFGLGGGILPRRWPWEPHWWKPSSDPIRNLVKAGALIAAEIDRLKRLEK